MTVQEAIEKLKYIKYIGNGEQEYKKCSESIAIDMAIEALEKQIPKKPIEDHTFDFCPVCSYSVDYLRNYCKECGQKLDWGD